MKRLPHYLTIGLLLSGATMAQAQSEATTDAAPNDALLTQAEIETLVAPVALYPDTLLMQILVASTYPLEIVKADNLLTKNAGADSATLESAIDAAGYDPSVGVLATAFPEVVTDMAEHVEWTEAMGDAMLAQSDDVMSGIQTMRQQAIDSGALISGAAQTVEVNNEDEVIIQPTDPEVVYVPQYDPQVVYADNGSDVGDIVMAGAIAFGTYAVMDAIFDTNDPWNDYWGCRNCGGWSGNPIIRNPNIDIDVDGNVNIGNEIDLGDREWKPDDKRRKDAKDKIADRKGPGGATTLPVRKGDNRGDAMRANLAQKSGAADISRPGAAGKLPQVNRPSARPANIKHDAISKTRPGAGKASVNRPASKRPAIKKPAAARPAGGSHKVTRKAPHKASAMQKRAPSHKARAASHRGGGGGHRRRR
ncbi:DUF3300 domain-containing protein [Sedimentitalea todarodis]|uniref:DUF3300 domain-containing protein n=1 Tax=Sedimentitalea todarodis TaxID=1631240 RepID=A0ABU3VC38_9RHOB|nr:DUF3300 domain-containing protein [Sedimentitalea todarodis]MDU9003736.1 DUF3300 domain-containing protein [Sedimentitalea todarodis]